MIKGFGRNADLDGAYGTYLEAREWLDGCRPGLEADDEEEDEEEEWAATAWTEASKQLSQAMVEVAAVHPRGLLLASELLEKAKGKGERLAKGYYAQLIEGLATAHDLKAQLAALDRSGVMGGGRRVWSTSVSDGTVGALMDATSEGANDERSRRGALERLRQHGVVLESKVAQYLASGQREAPKAKAARRVNANDEIVGVERGEPASPSALFDPASAARAPASGGGDVEVEPSAAEMYNEFEAMLATVDPRPRDGEPKPPRDTKKSVDFRRLRNLGS
jgi:hypothetical protein